MPPPVTWMPLEITDDSHKPRSWRDLIFARSHSRAAGCRVAIQNPDPDASGMQLADRRIVGAFGDPAAAAELAECSDVITLDTKPRPRTWATSSCGLS